MTDVEILEGAIKVLRGLETPKLWMTARGLARRMRKQTDFGGLTQTRLYRVLLEEHAGGEGHRRVRNSRFPSVHTLETLWGAIRTNGNGVVDADVPAPILGGSLAESHPSENQVREGRIEDAGEELEESPNYFLSYNFNDAQDVESIAGVLEERGYPIWFAGAQIMPGQNINSEVMAALQRAQHHFLYLTSSSLQSLWVGKEVLVGLSNELERTIIVGAQDQECLALVKAWMDGNETADTKRFEQQRTGVSEEAALRFHEVLMSHVQDSSSQVYLFSQNPEAPGLTHTSRLRPLQQIPVQEG